MAKKIQNGFSKKPHAPYVNNLSIELYYENDMFGAYIDDNTGSTGYDCKGTTPQECGEQVAQYIVDMFYKV